MKYKIIDNFLSEQEFEVYDSLPGCGDGNQLSNIPMYYSGLVGDAHDTDLYYFIHHLHNGVHPESELFNSLCMGILKNLKFAAIIRAKLNWYPRTEEIQEHAPHIDQHGEYYYVNALFYCNDNNGFTRFYDNEGGSMKIDSKRNRMVLFEGDIPHNSSTCTDKKMRVSMNLNLIPDGNWF